MSKIWQFHGGIHPPENKQQSLQQAIRQLPLPTHLTVPLQQHIGGPADPLVKIGDKVLKGQLIAQPVGHISVGVHAPSSGTVTDIAAHPVPHASGMPGNCIIIETDGEERWTELHPHPDHRSLDKSALTTIIRRAGISGMGGAGFPTDIKLHLGDDHIVNTLIINAVECEPYITADDILMRERAEQIIAGLEISAHLINPTHCIIGIEDNKPEAARAMLAAIRNSELDAEVVVLPTKYPSGGERQLIKLVTGVEVASGKLPADVGIVVQNVSTLVAIHQAVHHGRPLISRITTVTGAAAGDPGNLEVLIGTPVKALLDFCAVDQSQLTRLVMGGPMMGITLLDPSVPVIKTSNCLIAGTAQEFPAAAPEMNCIRCGNCEQVCPAELLPQQLLWFAKGRELDKAKRYNLLDCIECGACAYVCPSNIPLVQYYRFAKGEIRREQQEQRQAEQARIRFEARQARLEQEKQEKEEKRKARAKAAAASQAQRKDVSEQQTSDKDDAQARIKALKTQAAVARTKLKKAEKALALAEEQGDTNLEALRSAVQDNQANSDKAQKALEAAESSEPVNTATPTLKELKVAAAIARTKVTKTAKALADAQSKQLPSAEPLAKALIDLTSKAEAAELAVQQLSTSAAPASAEQPTAPADPKQLKTAAAVARTKLKKAQKALLLAQEAGSDCAELSAQVATLEAQAAQAQADWDKAEGGADSSQPEPAGSVDLSALKSAAAIARTKVKKTQQALERAEAEGLPSAEQLSNALQELQRKAERAQHALADAQAQQEA